MRRQAQAPSNREVKLAVFFTQDKVDKHEYPVRDPGSSSYLATFEPAHVFADPVEAEGIRRGEPSPAPTPSQPCAAARPAASGTICRAPNNQTGTA